MQRIVPDTFSGRDEDRGQGQGTQPPRDPTLKSRCVGENGMFLTRPSGRTVIAG
ncbi:hypothetical protein ACWCRC_05305 [Streptomyces sp. NPDC001940]|uniref:hypothetical protein n=1 Tax=unclassified Streptomyces TaxID=2593676 RepID=UPI0035DCE91E